MGVVSLDSVASLDTVFAPVRSQTAFEETVDRLGTAIKLGLLPPGTRLPAERELCAKLGIARSTLRDARELFVSSSVARAAFGDEVVDHYAHAAAVELAAFDAAVTDWERARGFERL